MEEGASLSQLIFFQAEDGIRDIGVAGVQTCALPILKGTKVVGEWHDMHCRIAGEEVNTLQRIFLKMWNKVSRQNIPAEPYLNGGKDISYFKNLKADECESCGQKMIGIINREPRISNQIIRTFYLSAINNAKDSIKLINPYFTLNRKIKKALKKAVSRGIKVEIMLSIKSDIPLTPDCGFYNAHKLMKRSEERRVGKECR